MVARVVLVGVGVALPYLARVPRAVEGWPRWMAQYTCGGLCAALVLGAFNTLVWVPLLAGSFTVRSATAVIVMGVVGFAFPAYEHARLDLSADAQAGIGMVMIPAVSLPLTSVAWLAGFGVDRGLRWLRTARPETS